MRQSHAGAEFIGKIILPETGGGRLGQNRAANASYGRGPAARFNVTIEDASKPPERKFTKKSAKFRQFQ
jgi:hypothetical protein